MPKDISIIYWTHETFPQALTSLKGENSINKLLRKIINNPRWRRERNAHKIRFEYFSWFFNAKKGTRKSLKRIFYKFFNFLFAYIFITPSSIVFRFSHDDSLINGFTLFLQHNNKNGNNPTHRQQFRSADEREIEREQQHLINH